MKSRAVLVAPSYVPNRTETHEREGAKGLCVKDQRLKVFEAALGALTESLDALVRVTRWPESEPQPEPLRTAVAKLNERLSSAGRLTSGTFVGSPVDTKKVRAMCGTMTRLDAAYVAFRKRLTTRPDQAMEAAASLETDIAEATALAASM